MLLLKVNMINWQCHIDHNLISDESPVGHYHGIAPESHRITLRQKSGFSLARGVFIPRRISHSVPAPKIWAVHIAASAKNTTRPSPNSRAPAWSHPPRLYVGTSAGSISGRLRLVGVNPEKSGGKVSRDTTSKRPAGEPNKDSGWILSFCTNERLQVLKRQRKLPWENFSELEIHDKLNKLQ